MSELEPRKTVGLGLMALGLCLIVLAAFAATPRTAWAQKDKDQWAGEAKAPVAAPQTPAVACEFLYAWIKDGSEPNGLQHLTQHINKSCNPAYAITAMPAPVTSVGGGPNGIIVCCVPK